MSRPVNPSWHEANQRYLTAALGVVREALERGVTPDEGGAAAAPPRSTPARQALNEAARQVPAPAALDRLCEAFGLSAFERDVLLLCAGMELDASWASRCAAAQGDPQRPHPTFGLALAALPEAHWSALTPTAPLRYWRLVEVGAGSTLAASPLRIDERVLHYLTGIQHLDEHLAGFVRPVEGSDPMVPSHRAAAGQIAALWSREPGTAVQLSGDEGAAKRAVAAGACEALGLHLHVMPAEVLPAGPHELDVLARLWEREALLGGAALLLDADEVGKSNDAQERLVARFAEGVRSPLLLTVRERSPIRHRAVAHFAVRKPTQEEQRALWLERLGPTGHALNGQIDRLAAQFDLGAPAIGAVCAQVHAGPPTRPPDGLGERLWEACRAQARPRFDDLAQPIEPRATWDDLVLPEPQRRVLRDVALHVRERTRVYQTWGFAARSERGLGISALFHGPSGTGKTMAAEVLAHELHLDLYRIDLSQVVSKYIGETERNLRRVFDAAEEGGGVLLFDEADALFGKRTEVRDSHDRYANIEVSYLLQRMEAYRGLAILTTNLKGALDDAFQRRIRFMVSFPFPNAAQRAEIWRRVFPPEMPTEGLDADKLARLNVTGGHIRNVALNAAFLAADAGEPVQMTHLLQAARSEYAKLEKPLTDTETRGWL